MRHALAATLLALAGAALPRPAQAEASTRWSCWLSDSQQDVACLLDRAPALLPASDNRARVEADQRAAAARLDPRLPPIVRSMRLTPQAWRAKVVFIPLHGVAFADSALGPLAQAVLCGSMPHCRADLADEPASHGPQFVALLADANDPLLAD